ncbi:class I SAM-dependent methyltransferase [Marinomonas dokdonensis]|uniref:class I SAM-dependent methyltransferase n=1 Tax=Marinomonas dokdonensis TaxID=328224 RepID=UPI0040558F2F
MDLKNSTALYYDTFAKDFAEGTVHADMSALYERFLPLIPEGAYILDAGCGSGRDTKHFQSLGHRVLAFDASPELARLASEYLQTDVLVKTFQTLDESNRFDAAWCCASLLHVPKSELSDAILKLHRALKLGGILYMSFKYGDQERLKEGRFFCDQNEGTIVDYLDGFDVQDMWVSGDVRQNRNAEQWLNVLVKKKLFK